jgi:hypothetical protein
MKKKLIIAAVVLALLSGADAQGAEYSPIQTGYDLITKLSAMDRNPTDCDGWILKTADVTGALEHLSGVAAGFAFIEVLSPTPEIKGAIDRVERMTLGQIIMIYQEWAKDNPERLNLPAAKCVFMALFPGLGQKK